MKLKSKAKTFIVSIGVKRHLIKWGIPEENIFELDWWEEKIINNIRFISTPGRHFSGRSMNDRNLSLWGGFAIQSVQENIWFSGDSGYGPHFKMIGDRLGPFDLGFIECGQYSEHWKNIHLFPEDSVKASKEARVRKAIPIHWAGFSISQHDWKEPAQRFVKEAIKENLDYCLPQLGEIFKLETENKYEWWEKLK